MPVNTLYSVKIIVKQSSYSCYLVSLSDNNHDPFGKCTKPPKESFWQWPVTSTNFSVALLHFQSKQTKQRVSQAVQGKLFPHWSLTEAQPIPGVSSGCTKVEFCILCEDSPSAEKQARAVPSPTPPDHLFDMDLFRCLQRVFSFLLSNKALGGCANVPNE